MATNPCWIRKSLCKLWLHVRSWRPIYLAVNSGGVELRRAPVNFPSPPNKQILPIFPAFRPVNHRFPIDIRLTKSVSSRCTEGSPNRMISPTAGVVAFSESVDTPDFAAISPRLWPWLMHRLGRPICDRPSRRWSSGSYLRQDGPSILSTARFRLLPAAVRSGDA